MTLPNCILLNGTSSSGKTSIAKALQELLPEVFLNFSIDNVLYALPPSDLENMISGVVIVRRGYSYKKLVKGFHASIAALLATENNLIVDNAISSAWMREDFDSVVKDFRTFRIGVHCDVEEARRREIIRGDRKIGTVDYEFPRVHIGMVYDIEIDTTKMSAMDSAEIIIQALSAPAQRA